jgi:hypothetical protein
MLAEMRRTTWRGVDGRLTEPPAKIDRLPRAITALPALSGCSAVSSDAAACDVTARAEHGSAERVG